MGTTLHTLTPPKGARQKKQRIGRGIGSGRGKTSTRGMKGQLARRTATKASFEGGQLPIHRRVPKRGFNNIHRIPVHGVNLLILEANFDANTEVTPEVLRERGLIPKRAKVVKILATGDLTKALTLKVHQISKAAADKVTASGGTISLLAAPAEDAEASS